MVKFEKDTHSIPIKELQFRPQHKPKTLKSRSGVQSWGGWQSPPPLRLLGSASLIIGEGRQRDREGGEGEWGKVRKSPTLSDPTALVASLPQGRERERERVREGPLRCKTTVKMGPWNICTMYPTYNVYYFAH